MAVEARAERAFTTSVGPTYFTAEEWAEVTAAVRRRVTDVIEMTSRAGVYQPSRMTAAP